MPLFTRENARQYQARAVVARKSRATYAEPESPPSPQVAGTDSYSEARLSRVRRQLDRLDTMVERETDPMKLDKLASAQARLAEQERLLAGRPLPGSRRPERERPKRQWASMVDFDPQPLMPIAEAPNPAPVES